MKQLLMTCAWMMAAWSGVQAQPAPSWPEVRREAKAGSRWWWLGSAVDKDNLKWQMEQLAAAGIGTLEITPIYGVQGNTAKNIAFLTPTWLAMMNYTQQVGQQLGIDIDMTTGTGWPFGGPMVKNNESASKLVTETFDVTGDGNTEKTLTLNTSNGALQRVMAFPQSGNIGSVTNLTAMVNGKSLKWTAPQGNWKVIAAYNQYGVMQVKRPSPGSGGYVVDYFSATAVANYLKYFDSKFEAANAQWPHSFFNDSYEINAANWTPQMFEEFESRRGYKLDENLDKLLNKDSQVYADYRLTLSDMLRDNFTRQWTAWAHSHGVTTRNQAHGSPGNLIDLYAEADIPETENFYLNDFGIKGLRNDKGFYLSALSSKATLKYASSAAHITGKPLTSSESMTWLTEHFRTSLSQIKPELDLLFTSGVNHVMFHGTAYSPREAAWPGWKFYAAIDMSPTNTIWHDAPAMMKYIERVQSFMQMGQPDNEVLVYAPFVNAMHKTTGEYQNMMVMFDINKLTQKMPETEQCVKELEVMGLDCDYTSEQFLMGTTCENGVLKTKAGTCYQALVIPTTANMPDSIKSHIEALRQQGATIVEGYKADQLKVLTIKGEEMRTALGLSVIRRSNTSGYHYFVANLTADDVEGYVSLAVPYQSAALFDPMTGDIKKAVVKDGKLWVSLKSGQSMILQTYDSEIELPATATPVQELSALDIDGQWTLSIPDGQTYKLEGLSGWEKLDDQMKSYIGTGTYNIDFTVSASQMKTATGGFMLDLGDVRESADVWLNGEYLGCAWAAPFMLDCSNGIREGSNTLRIDVTNLPANRISEMDRQGTVWRIFEDINMSNISSDSYAAWTPVPSGLNSKVRLIPLATKETAMVLQLKQMVADADGAYYAQYTLALPDGCRIASMAMTDTDGTAFSGYESLPTADNAMLITMKGKTDKPVIVTVTDTDGVSHYGYLQAHGAYTLLNGYDFTSEAALTGEWSKMGSTMDIIGFTGSGKQAWYRSNKNVTSNTALYNGLTFSSEKNTYYGVFPGYGLFGFNDFTLTVDQPNAGDMLHISYMKGEGETVYQPADSASIFILCENKEKGLCAELYGRNSYYLYRKAVVYRPLSGTTAIKTVTTASDDTTDSYYTLQGIRVNSPKKGVYIHRGKKVVVR